MRGIMPMMSAQGGDLPKDLQCMRGQPLEWCLIAVPFNRQLDWCNNFRRFGLRCYCPNYINFGRRLPRRKRGIQLLIPGYLFSTGFKEPAFWEVVKHGRGMVNVVRTFSGQILLLHNDDVLVIRKIEAGLNTPTPGKSLHNFKTGEKVRFSGDLLGRWPSGTVAYPDDGRIIVEVELMGRAVPFTVYPHQIERMQASLDDPMGVVSERCDKIAS
jgi:transcription antitermination factor NusG